MATKARSMAHVQSNKIHPDFKLFGTAFNTAKPTNQLRVKRVQIVESDDPWALTEIPSDK